MRIKGYKLFLENQQTKEEIDSICQKYSIENYTINDDGTVDVDDDVYLYNKGLTKLPLKFGKVSGFFNCSKNQLTSLKGAPYYVGRYFDCSRNNLTTLEDGPKTIIGDYYCNGNSLVNFKGFPEDFDGYVNFDGNPVNKILINIPYNKSDKFIYWCNEYDAIDERGKVIPERMEEVYHKLEFHKIGLKYNYVNESLKYLNINNINDYIFYQIPFKFFKEGKCIKGDDDYVLCFSSNFVYDYITDDDIEKALKQDLSKIDVSKDWTFYNNKNYENAYTDKSKHVLRIAKLVNEIKNGVEIVPISMFFDERSYFCDIKNYIEDGNHRVRALQYLKYDYFPAYVYGNFTKYLIKELN